MFPHEEVLTLISIIKCKAFQGMGRERCSEVHVYRESGAVRFVHLIDNKSEISKLTKVVVISC